VIHSKLSPYILSKRPIPTKVKGVFFVLLFALVFCLSLFYIKGKYGDMIHDHAYFGGDVWQYQSLGVNLLFGHGYKLGGLEGFKTYKYGVYKGQPREEIEGRFRSFTSGARHAFSRSPGYPLFIAGVYKVFGIHPRVVKILQIVMVAITTALMPLIGWYYWNRWGIFSGLVSGLLFNIYFSPDVWRLMSETFNIFGLTMWIPMLIIWEKRPSFFRTIIMGMATAMVLLIRGSNSLVALSL